MYYSNSVDVTNEKNQTCFSVDYVPHPLEKHYVHQSEKYRPPEGEMEMTTNYTTEYTSMYYAIIFSRLFNNLPIVCKTMLIKLCWLTYHAIML